MTDARPNLSLFPPTWSPVYTEPALTPFLICSIFFFFFCAHALRSSALVIILQSSSFLPTQDSGPSYDYDCFFTNWTFFFFHSFCLSVCLSSSPNPINAAITPFVPVSLPYSFIHTHTHTRKRETRFFFFLYIYQQPNFYPIYFLIFSLPLPFYTYSYNSQKKTCF